MKKVTNQRRKRVKQRQTSATKTKTYEKKVRIILKREKKKGKFGENNVRNLLKKYQKV